MPQHAPQQSMQQMETIPGRPVIRASAVRLVSSHLYQPFQQEKMGTLQSLFGKVPGTADQLYICLHPASAPGLPLPISSLLLPFLGKPCRLSQCHDLQPGPQTHNIVAASLHVPSQKAPPVVSA